MTRIKICGLTREADVKLAVSCGAWACGFVVSSSPRHIDVARAADLTPLTRNALAVAVVTTEGPDWIAAAVEEGGFDAVQLSAGADGSSVSEVRAALERRGLRPRLIAAADTEDAADADLMLLDARRPDQYGGTGSTLDWKALAATKLPRERVVLAGGLRPSNVDGAIHLLHPFAVDVGSGVERSPGVKEHRLLRSFFGAVAGADHTGGAAS
jgi:phosphoribosylanthranilate isomerase